MRKEKSKKSDSATMAYDIEYRKKFIEISEEDAKRMKRLQPVGEKHIDEIMDDLYAHFLKFPETNAFLQSEKHVKNLKGAQTRFFMDLLSGEYDERYLDSRLSVGRTHERIGLEPQWYIGAYSKYMNLIIPKIFEANKAKPAEAMKDVQGVIKMIFLDMGFAIDTYIEAMNNRENAMKAEFVENLTSFADSLNNSATSIAAATSEQSATVAEQASSVHEVTSTVAEVKQTSIQAAEHANNMVESASTAVEASKQGTKAVEDSIQGMHEIQKQVEAIADKILSLSEQTQQIGEIIQSVNEIAEQSKLLALNAAIEAARAGEHGRGFSVVASEIRNLADQSKQATNQVRGILGEIQKATNGAVIATEEGSKKVDAGVVLANQAGENIHQLSKAISASADSGKTISSSSQQQTAGVEQISAAMQQISTASQDTLKAVKRTESVAKDLKDLTNVINDLLQTYTEEKQLVVEWKLA